MSTLVSEGRYPGDWMKAEVIPESRVCREAITLASTGTEYTLQSGTVLAKFTSGGSSGKYGAHNPDGSDGSQTVAAILFLTTTVPATGDIVAAAVVRGPCVVCEQALTWSADSDLDQAAAVTALEALGIQVRDGL